MGYVLYRKIILPKRLFVNPSNKIFVCRGILSNIFKKWCSFGVNSWDEKRLSDTYDYQKHMTSYLNDKRSKVKLKQRLNWSLRDCVIVNRMFCDLMFLKVDENILDKFMINPYLQIIHYGLSGLIHIMMPLLQRSGQYLHWVLCNIDFVRNCSHFPVHKVYESAVM